MNTIPGKFSNSWFVRYKLYHIPFWCLYHYIWWSVAVGNPVKAAESLVFFPNSIKYGFYVVLEALAVYFNLYYLLPKYFEKKKYGWYAFSVLATVFITALLIVAGYYGTADLTGKTLRQLYGDGSNCFYYFFGYALPSAAASMTLAMTIKFAKNRIVEDRRQQMIAQQNIQTELNFLKHQFNPHFLFNSINSIFVLIRKNPTQASSALAKFSELLRHQLYECNDQMVTLNKEIEYLRNYIDLEKLRQNGSTNIDIQISAAYNNELEIAPFIIMTFVENAFKHSSRDSLGQSKILIAISLDGNILHLKVANTKGQSFPNQTGGIGLKTVQRRLELIYPFKHQLRISDTDNWYETELRLTLKEADVTLPLMKIV